MIVFLEHTERFETQREIMVNKNMCSSKCSVNPRYRVSYFIITRERRTYSSEFKLQIVKLYENRKLRNEIVHGYDLTPSALNKWIKNHQNSDSFNTVDIPGTCIGI